MYAYVDYATTAHTDITPWNCNGQQSGKRHEKRKGQVEKDSREATNAFDVEKRVQDVSLGVRPSYLLAVPRSWRHLKLCHSSPEQATIIQSRCGTDLITSNAVRITTRRTKKTTCWGGGGQRQRHTTPTYQLSVH